ncbi:MAG: phosphohistidine phosphatase SixA [Xenococcaceae cyanobacterium MO_234.B1]|nr:phosphohistidine phosphatase SixA [Xenococcaceae cyanobacterium MO_234.B1]
MEIYLIRHGIAAERGTYTNDRERPLVAKGINKTQKVAEKLQSIGIEFDLILSSPLVRAFQTAEILLKAGLSSTLDTFTPLEPGGNIKDWLQWLQEMRSRSAAFGRSQNSLNQLAFVGHQPDLGNWAEMLVWGSIRNQVIVKKAGIVGLRLPDSKEIVGHSELFLLTSPKWFM